MAEIGERVATCEERIAELRRDMDAIVLEQRNTRHAVRGIQEGIRLTTRVQAVEQRKARREHEQVARRERRLFALAGLTLTAINVAVVVAAFAVGGH